MSKGKVVNGESVGVGSITESFTVGSTGRYGVMRTNPFLRKGEKPSERPTWRQSEIDDTIRYKKAGCTVISIRAPRKFIFEFKISVPGRQ